MCSSHFLVAYPFLKEACMVQKPWLFRFSQKFNLNCISMGMMLWDHNTNQTDQNYLEHECDHCLEVAD